MFIYSQRTWWEYLKDRNIWEIDASVVYVLKFFGTYLLLKHLKTLNFPLFSIVETKQGYCFTMLIEVEMLMSFMMFNWS